MCTCIKFWTIPGFETHRGTDLSARRGSDESSYAEITPVVETGGVLCESTSSTFIEPLWVGSQTGYHHSVGERMFLTTSAPMNRNLKRNSIDSRTRSGKSRVEDGLIGRAAFRERLCFRYNRQWRHQSWRHHQRRHREVEKAGGKPISPEARSTVQIDVSWRTVWPTGFRRSWVLDPFLQNINGTFGPCCRNDVT